MVVDRDNQQILFFAYHDVRHMMCNSSIREVQVFDKIETAKDSIEETILNYLP